MNSHGMLVADLMAVDPITIPVDAPLEDAGHLCRSMGISGLPVIDGAGYLVGVISQSDLVAIQDSPLGRLIRAEPSGLRVGEVMSSPAITVPMTASLAQAARLMRDDRIHRVVALDEAGRPVGVLTSSDFVTLFADDEP
jgi:CBS domain-containing protein